MTSTFSHSLRARRCAVTLGAALALACACDCDRAGRTAEPTIFARDLVDDPEAFVDRIVELDVIEPLNGAATEEQRVLDWGGHDYVVEVPDGRAHDAPSFGVALVPERFRKTDPKRHQLKFDRVLTSPLHVRGEVTVDTFRAARSPMLAVRVIEARPLALGTPLNLTPAQAVSGAYDRHLVALTGKIERGVEQSSIGGVWVRGGLYRTGAFGPASREDVHVGILFSRKDGGYGHLGRYAAELITEVE